MLFTYSRADDNFGLGMALKGTDILPVARYDSTTAQQITWQRCCRLLNHHLYANGLYKWQEAQDPLV